MLEWSERAAANEPGFNVDQASLHLDQSILMQAEAEYDRMQVKTEKKPQVELYIMSVITQ